MIAMEGADPTDPRPMRQPDHRKHSDRSKEQSPIGKGEDDQTSKQLNNRPGRVVDEPKNEFRDPTGIVPEHARHTAGPQVMDSLQWKSDDVVEHDSTNVDREESGCLRRKPASAEADRDGGEGDDDHGNRDRDEQSTGIGKVPRGWNPSGEFRGESGSRERVIDREFGRRRRGQLQPSCNGQGAQGDDNRASMTTEHREKLAEQVRSAPGPLQRSEDALSTHRQLLSARLTSTAPEKVEVGLEPPAARTGAKARILGEVWIL